ncbi:MAG TPA: sugar ABC transporter permease [Limnochordales bacterium]
MRANAALASAVRARPSGALGSLWRRIRANRIAYALILPAVLGMIFVHYLPMVWGLLVSLKEVNMYTVADWMHAPWVGLQNYATGFDPATRVGARFWRSLLNVTFFGAVTITAGYVIGMAVALLLNRPFPGQSLVRGLVLLPYITPDSVAYSVWRFIFQARIGLVNKWLLGLGLVEEPPIWLVGWRSIYAVMVAAIWKGWPFASLVLLAGLQSIPAEIHEAAMIDGASPWQRFWRVTLPLLAPVSRTLILMSILWNYNAFNQFFIMLGRDPGEAADVPSTLILRETFTSFNFGVGSAMSVALMIIMLVFTVLYLRALRSPAPLKEM